MYLDSQHCRRGVYLVWIVELLLCETVLDDGLLSRVLLQYNQSLWVSPAMFGVEGSIPVKKMYGKILTET